MVTCRKCEGGAGRRKKTLTPKFAKKIRKAGEGKPFFTWFASPQRSLRLRAFAVETKSSRCGIQLRRLQKIVVARRVELQVAHTFGIDHDVVEVPEVDI